MMKAQYISPVITVFDKHSELDREGNICLYDFLIENGLSGVAVAGSSGEQFSMTGKQIKELIDLSVPYIKGKMKVLIGTGRLRIDETAELCDYAANKGADGVLVMSPYYFTLSADGIYDFYDEVAKSTKAKIYLYNFPARTGYSIPVKVAGKLARKHKNIVGLKDSVPGMDNTRELICEIMPHRPEFEIFSGYDENFVHNVLSGGSGCIAGLSNIVPNKCSEWERALNAGDLKTVERLQKYINRMMDIYSVCTPFIPALKKALVLQGVIKSDRCISSFGEVTKDQEEKIREILGNLEVI